MADWQAPLSGRTETSAAVLALGRVELRALEGIASGGLGALYGAGYGGGSDAGSATDVSGGGQS